ncbi:MAG: MopE-related protein, partial [Pseudomonadota bacterium]|nr:MopE-related protein [Pseudomonadota bacterium]
DAPAGYVADTTDCDDTAFAINPAATDVCDAANTDEDCDTLADNADPSATDETTFYLDADGDSYGSDTTGLYCDLPYGYVVDTTDCDDTAVAISPAATEVCDAANTDEDCNSLADNADPSATGETTFYVDSDEDGYGSDTTGLYCDLPEGYVADTTDCDDSAAAVNPAATELCDAADTDEDCDGLADNADPSASAATKTAYYTDFDGDAYGSTSTASYCDLPANYAVVNTDCNDSVAAINPGATELCDAANTDEDCDGLTDNADPSADEATKGSYYVDSDGDGYGSTVAAPYCDQPAGYSADDTDCDDTVSTTHPAATDTTGDGIDSDCDGAETCYTDADDDGFRPNATSTVASANASCDERGEALATTPTGDCDDAASAINPSATEIAGDAIDQDCDTTESCYVDADHDGARTDFVVPSPDVACTAPGEALASADPDCDDADATAYPAATELTGSGVDEDCDGVELCYVDADDDAYRPDSTTTIASSDGDCDDGGEALASALTGDCDDTSTAYNPAAVESVCSDPNDYNCDGSTGYSNADGDAFAACEECDDNDATVFPGAAETTGDGIDSDCDGGDTCYVDSDDDGYRPDATSTIAGSIACDSTGEASNLDPTGDCDDTDGAVNPAALETIGDELDADCDGAESCYGDADADGYRTEDGAAVASDDTDCADVGEAAASAAFDCDDSTDTINPSATEVAGDELDADCDDTELCFVDADADGYRPDASSTVVSANITCADSGEALASAATTDCDDTNATVNPSAIEAAGDAIDSDCDGTELCYADADDDGYVDGTDTTLDSLDADCDDANEALVTTQAGDCDDADAAYNPGAVESDCADPNDYNCDGSVGYDDADADGYAACEECDDSAASISPAATEIAGDGIDQDCDGTETCYVDADDDGYRPDATSMASSANIACDGAGEALSTDAITDCDDSDATVNPSATELAGDEYDQDCDGTESCYVDADDDGYTAEGGAIIVSTDLLCDGTGEASDLDPSQDCDDANAAFNPAAIEDDCSDPADYNCDGSSGFSDADADGFAACEECDDASGTVNPEADEVCNDIDDDCDGTIDIDAIDAGTWYADADADGYTDLENVVTECDAPEGYLAETEADCDDADATSFPGGDELPDDGIDQDCDGEDAIGEDTDTDVPDDDTGGGKDEEPAACGCASTSGVGLAWSLMLGVVALTVRRRAA